MKSIFLTLSAIFFLISCSNEPIGKMEINKDALDEELIDLVSRVSTTEGENTIGCLRFNYPFVVFLLDSLNEVEDFISLHSDPEFLALLETIDSTNNISISYPIKATLNNGELLEINNNEELRESISKCAQDEIVGKCNNFLKLCTWTVVEASQNAEIYIGTQFKETNSGALRYYADNVYLGTWVSLFIEETLHLNIFTIGNDSPNSFWNKDWIITSFSENSFELTHEETIITIEKNCEMNCPIDDLKGCKVEENSEIAVFNLKDFRKCIGYNITLENPVSILFYKTQEDANQNINAIENTNTFENTTNPQTLYIKAWNTVTHDSITTNKPRITLKAISCD
ncbi:MAG: hypothetical protein R2781_07485 [Flavobacteriaceae bacterium]